MIEVSVLGSHQDKDGMYHITFKYWVRGDCACGAIRKKSVFDHYPTVEEIKKSI